MPNIFDAFGGPSGDVPGGLPSSRVGIAETFPRILAAGNFQPASAQWNAVACYLPGKLTVTGITFFSGATALNTATHQWFGIWDNTLTLWAGSADDTSTAWAAHTAKRLTLTTAKRTTYSGLYYVGVEITASVAVPSLSCIGTAVGSGALRALTPAAVVLDTTTADTALAATLTQTATTTGSGGYLYAVLD